MILEDSAVAGRVLSTDFVRRALTEVSILIKACTLTFKNEFKECELYLKNVNDNSNYLLINSPDCNSWCHSLKLHTTNPTMKTPSEIKFNVEEK